MSSVPKCDRFIKQYKFETPPPNNYNVKNSLNENFNSTHQQAQQTVFGSNTKTFIDQNWRLDAAKNQPGPGAYTAFSDFGGAQ